VVDRRSEAKGVLRTIWKADGDPEVALDADCSPTKVCRNMKGITFDGYGDGDTDPADAWRAQLEREGKYDPSAGTLRDLVAGTDR
jgi:hypothetical protein